MFPFDVYPSGLVVVSASLSELCLIESCFVSTLSYSVHHLSEWAWFKRKLSKDICSLAYDVDENLFLPEELVVKLIVQSPKNRVQ